MPLTLPPGKRMAVALTFDFDAHSNWMGALGRTSPSYLSRGDFGADSDDLCDSVSGPNRKTGPRIEVLLRVNSESTRYGMNDGHLGQHIRHNQRDASSKQIRQNHGRACKSDGYAASQK